MNKEELRAMLAEKAGDYQGEVVLYAAKPLPERKPWQRRPTPAEENYQAALAAAEAERKGSE